MNAIAGIGSAQSSTIAQQMSGIRDEIKSAVQSALEKTGETGDHRQAVRDAINAVLEEHGIDAEEFRAQMGSMRESLGMPKPDGLGVRPGKDLEGSGEETATATQGKFFSSLMDILAELNGGQAPLRPAEFVQNPPPGTFVNQVA